MLKYEVMAMNSLLRLKEQGKEALRKFFTDEEGDTNLISIIVVLVIVMALALLFRNNITKIVKAMWGKIETSTGVSNLDKEPTF